MKPVTKYDFVEHATAQQEQVAKGKFVIIDRVLFLTPRDKELQWPAMTVVQSYVNGFKQKMEQAEVTQGRIKFELEYNVSISKEDMAVFEAAGLVLNQQPQALSEVDMLVDMTDRRIAMYKNSSKHACQICGIMAGVGGVSPLPMVKKLARRLQMPRWGILQGGLLAGF